MTVKRSLLLILAVLMLPGLALAQTQTRATFNVDKDFTDGNPGAVEVTLSCNTGLPLEQSEEITEAAPDLEFVVVEFDDGELNCELTEAVPAGYEATYDTTGSVSTIAIDGDGCAYANVLTGHSNECLITNDPLPVEVVIDKDWTIIDSGELNGVDPRYTIRLECDGEISNASGNGDISNYQSSSNVEWDFYGDDPVDATYTAMVKPDEFGNNECHVEETVYDSAIETSNNCASDFDIDVAGGPYECLVTNTVFFEGIPTLNQYGLAILAMVMLGVGFVGFRRFA